MSYSLITIKFPKTTIQQFMSKIKFHELYYLCRSKYTNKYYRILHNRAIPSQFHLSVLSSKIYVLRPQPLKLTTNIWLSQA